MATLALPVNIIYTLGCGFVSLIVLFLNPVIVSVIYNDRQLRRQPSIIYIVNLALVDLCFAGVTFTTTLFRFLHLAGLYPLCLLLHLYLPMSLITASLLLMFTNSVDRFIFIRMSLKYHSIMNSRVAKRVAIGIWTYSAAFPLLPNVICDHFWKYDSCADIVATPTYRLLHIPLQATFFITIVFTAFMFVSVFRVVKNSRRLRHVPARSSSMDSLSTMVSSPTLNTSTPSLPPILELIPYEHDHSLDSAACPPERPFAGSGSIPFPESHRCCVPATREIISGNCLCATDEPATVNTSLPTTEDGLALRSCVSRTRNAMSLHVSLQTQSILPDLIVSQLWLEDLAEDCGGDTDISQTDAVSDSKTPDTDSDLRKKARFQEGGARGHISVTRRLSVTSDLVAKSSDVLTESADMGAELREDICSFVMTTATVEDPDPIYGAFGDGMKLTSDISVRAITREEMAAPDISAALNVALEQPEMPGPSNQHGAPPSISRNWRLSKSGRKHLFKWDKTDGKWQLGPKKNAFFKSRGYKVKSADSLYSYRVKMKSTIPREPLEMLKFKLDKWSSNETITNSDLHEDETCLSVSANTTPMSDRRSLVSNHTHTNRPTGTHNNMLQLSALPSRRHRRRSVSTSDNSSTVSMDSSSSYSHLTTESTVPSECGSSGLQKPGTTSHALADVPDTRATATPRKVNSSVSDPGPGASRRRDSGIDLPQRSRLLSVRADIKLSTRRPPRLRRLSPTNASHSNTADSPRPPPRSPRWTFSRSISTLTTSSTSSIPFGASSYSGRDIRTVKILFIMFCVYIMLWLPAFVIQVLRYLDYDVSIEITLLVYTLGISNSVFNFFVYPMRIPKLRVSFQKLFKSAIADAKKNVHRCYCVVKGR
ncbi:hypothetical protein BsWGS_25510 [Bradybaena similaris]